MKTGEATYDCCKKLKRFSPEEAKDQEFITQAKDFLILIA